MRGGQRQMERDRDGVKLRDRARGEEGDRDRGIERQRQGPPNTLWVPVIHLCWAVPLPGAP